MLLRVFVYEIRSQKRQKHHISLENFNPPLEFPEFALHFNRIGEKIQQQYTSSKCLGEFIGPKSSIFGGGFLVMGTEGGGKRKFL